ncbi:MAG: ABC transporter ATP-binding protein, partial [Planctomycetes bacterium]|nr:ABC transporter ATP-binding protein [Planctomycetota bacterium]
MLDAVRHGDERIASTEGASLEFAVSTRGLGKRYGPIAALDGVSLDVPRGSCFGLLGPNGAGKSTLVKCLLSIVRPSGGTATLLGRDIRDRESRRSIGYLPEGHRFPKYLSGRGVCHYFGRLSGLRGAELRRETEEKLAIVGMSDRAGDRVTQYSKGMKQRVGLAQAMLGDPAVIFLDEPTDGVDPVGRKAVREVIRSICARGCTVFLNSHLLSEVEMICDRVAILDRGRVVAHDSIEGIRSLAFRSGTGVRVAFRTGSIPDSVWSALSARGAERAGPSEFVMTLDDEEGIGE